MGLSNEAERDSRMLLSDFSSLFCMVDSESLGLIGVQELLS